MNGHGLDRGPGDLARRIAHAMRSPLGVVHGAFQDPGDPALHAKLLALGARAARQLDRLAARLAVIGQLRADPPLAFEPCDFVGVGDAAIEAIAGARVRKGIRLQRAFPDAACIVDADAALLQHAAAELVDNAVRFAKSAVEISLRSDATHVVFEAVNDGPSLDPEIFAAAIDGDKPLRDRSGLGAGLWSAAVIVNKHGGTLAQRTIGSDDGTAVELRVPHHPRRRRTSASQP